MNEKCIGYVRTPFPQFSKEIVTTTILVDFCLSFILSLVGKHLDFVKVTKSTDVDKYNDILVENENTSVTFHCLCYVI